MARPRYSFESLQLDFGVAIDTLAEAIVFDADDGIFHKLEDEAVAVRLPEQEFLRVGVCGLVGEVNRGVVVSGAAFLLGTGNDAEEFFSFGEEFFLVVFEPLFVHELVPTVSNTGLPKTKDCKMGYKTCQEWSAKDIFTGVGTELELRAENATAKMMNLDAMRGTACGAGIVAPGSAAPLEYLIAQN